LKLWGRVLARLSGALEEKLVWSSLTGADFIKTNTSENDLSEVIDELIINMPQVKVVVIIYETTKHPSNPPAEGSGEEQSSVALIYSMKNINSLDLVKEFNPTGTKTMARAAINKPGPEAEKEIIGSITEKLGKLPI
jgi:hypothetical protein